MWKKKRRRAGRMHLSVQWRYEKCSSNLQILRNFKNAVAEKNGQLLFEDNFYKDKEYFKLKKGGDTYWVEGIM